MIEEKILKELGAKETSLQLGDSFIHDSPIYELPRIDDRTQIFMSEYSMEFLRPCYNNCVEFYLKRVEVGKPPQRSAITVSKEILTDTFFIKEHVFKQLLSQE